MRHILDEQDVRNLANGRYLGDPFYVFGMHESTNDAGAKFIFVRTFQPQAKSVEVIDGQTHESLGTMKKIHEGGLFQLNLEKQAQFLTYYYKITLFDNQQYTAEDPYRFTPVLGDVDLYLYGEGQHWDIYKRLGAHLMTHQNVAGVSFAVWAPNAKRVSIVGNFNDWDGRRHMMRPRGASGIWEIFIPGLKEWDLYKYELIGADGTLLPLKTDPFGFSFEMRPKTGSLVYDNATYQWKDDDFIKYKRPRLNALDAPISIYEVHLGSWRRNPIEGNRWLTYLEMAEELPKYAVEMGFTHVEFLPVAEYPFDGSWGYQETGLYAPTSRYGSPGDFKYLIDRLHAAGIGVIIDWVPAHFPKDAFALANFDGTALYEHADPRRGEHMDWGTKIYNYSRNEVSNFLLANALFWIKEYHIDALRVDAVASMLYLDYSRKAGEWVPNEFGGRENLEAIAFLRKLNELVYGLGVGATTFAEESTAWPMVSRPTYLGGLGFGYKWNMGWMHDTLQYMSENPIHRKYHQNELTFSMLYAFTENFVLPLSHDEVVHGKRSMIDKMPGDVWQKFANLRTCYGYMFMHPGKKLLFMGNEIADWKEWNYADSIDWGLLKNEQHKGMQKLVADLNALYTKHKALYEIDFDWSGYEWIDGSDAENSVLTFMRHSKEKQETIIVACNFTPVPRRNYRIGVNEGGVYREIFNSDKAIYGGSGMENTGEIFSKEPGWHFKKCMIEVTLPPLAVVCFKLNSKIIV
ncbi:MAG: 1,4-alpha-glucan branching protein GlgB [Lactobacillales bacterium]|jgi:1,4-alpha-glucan branching enzyme|nr:1,4-alpha-glucan branching protein GlgB [Lactobacillales bacterium]